MRNGIPRIVILSAGFGGFYLALQLAKRLKRSRTPAEITLIDRNNYFLFSPLLHEVTVGMVEMRHIVHPVRHFLQGLPVRFLEAAVEKIDLDTRTVETSAGAIPYDVLVLALGSVTDDFGIAGVARYAFPLKTLGEAFRLRNHILTMFETAAATEDPDLRRQLLTFVQVGAGLTGIETVTELHDFIHESLLKDYPMIYADEIRLLLIDALPGLCVPKHPTLTARARHILNKKRIELRFNTRVTEAGPGWVQCGDERIPAHTLIWSAGIRANPLVADLPVEKGSLQRVKVRSTLQLQAYPEVFALGDCAYLEENDNRPLPTTAQVANQQAARAAENIVNYLNEKPLHPFVYRRLGELASLGSYHAVADLGAVRLSGFLAWWLWRTIYLAKTAWWNNRLRIAADWTLDFISPRNTARIEVESCPDCSLQTCPQHCRERVKV